MGNKPPLVVVVVGSVVVVVVGATVVVVVGGRVTGGGGGGGAAGGGAAGGGEAAGATNGAPREPEVVEVVLVLLAGGGGTGPVFGSTAGRAGAVVGGAVVVTRVGLVVVDGADGACTAASRVEPLEPGCSRNTARARANVAPAASAAPNSGSPAMRLRTSSRRDIEFCTSPDGARLEHRHGTTASLWANLCREVRVARDRDHVTRVRQVREARGGPAAVWRVPGGSTAHDAG
jgi:hypothetical protein